MPSPTLTFIADQETIELLKEMVLRRTAAAQKPISRSKVIREALKVLAATEEERRTTI